MNETILHAGNRQLDLSVPLCMGIINLTPDSFSDGSQLGRQGDDGFRVSLDKTLLRAETMLAEGAAILDIGGESTRPGAAPVSDQEQMDRVLPVVAAIRSNLDVCISVDSSSVAVMRAAIAAGAEFINDIRALSAPEAVGLIAESEAAVCLMHMQGQPGTMQQAYRYDDVVTEVMAFLKARVDACRQQGIARSRLLVDPGFGFGKSLQHNYRLLKDLPRFAALELPILLGISRKSMIGAVVGRPPQQRLAGSIAAATLALKGGASIIRSHDVAATVDAIRVHCAFHDPESAVVHEE